MDRPSNSNSEATATIGGDGTDAQGDDTSDTQTIRQTVIERLYEAIKPSSKFYNEPEAFVLECDLRRILNQETVQLVLDRLHEKYPERPIISLAAIFNEAKGTGRLKILATLIYIEKPKPLYDFITSDVWDDALPLSASDVKFSKRKGAWSREFVAGQYLFLPQMIDFQCMKHKEFHDSIRMPFLDPLDELKAGAHGAVSKVRIHQDYQSWGKRTRCKDHYAVKRFTADTATFERERDALVRFSHPNTGHRSLIQLLYSYELRSTKYLIFPCAEGDLEYHWANHGSDPKSQADLIWMLQECHGIACGLAKVHDHASWQVGNPDSGSQNKGRHGDIKPKNILFFRDEETSPGRLVVADFTLMRFHSSNADTTRIRNVDYSRTYLPPEMDTSKGAQVSQKYDIWTLGCVFLELITWHLLGSDAIRPKKQGCERGFVAPDGHVREDFGTSRQRDDNTGCRNDKFFNSFHDRPPIVKPSVIKWIDYLRGHEFCSEALHEFLHLIQRHMLVAKPEGRCSMFQVTTTMGRILSTARRSPAYCQPLQRPKLAGTHQFPHLLGSSYPYWSSDLLPKPQASQPLAPQDSEYDLLENVILSLNPPQIKSEGELVVQNGGSSLGRPSHSFQTGSTEILRESDDRSRSYVESVTPATTRQSSVIERTSHDSRRPEIAERDGGVEALPNVKIPEVKFGNSRGEDNVTGRMDPSISSKWQAVKTRVRMWRDKIKSALYRLLRMGRE